MRVPIPIHILRAILITYPTLFRVCAHAIQGKRTHARTHTHTHAHTHTHTYTHTQIMARFPNNAVVFKVFVELEERYGLSHRVRTHWERMWHGPARNAQVRV